MRPPLSLLRAVEALGGEAIRRRRLDPGGPPGLVLEVEREEARRATRHRHDGDRPQQRRRERADRVVRRLPDLRDLLLRAVAEENERQVERLRGEWAQVAPPGHQSVAPGGERRAV